VSRSGERRVAYRVLLRKPDEKSTLGSPRCRWEDKIKMDLQQAEWWSWSGFIWLRIRRSSRKKSHEPPCSVKCKAFLD
jgi:hypothetical protein